MSITKESIIGEMNEDHRSELKAKLDLCIANDQWAEKIFKKIALLIITYPGQRAYLRSCIETHYKLGYFIALSYDNYINPKDQEINHNDYMPDKDLLDKVDLLLMPHHQTWGDTDYPFFWALKWGSLVLQQFEYVYCLNGDFIIEKPEEFNKLLSLMEDTDIMTCGPDYENFLANGAFIVKSKVFPSIVKYMQDTYIPFEMYEKYIHKFHNAEERMAHAIRDLKLNKYTVKKPCIWDRKGTLPGTWYDIVGLRHIHGELDYAFKKKLVPPHYNYLDKKYLLDIYNYKSIKEYWDTKDISVLQNWWLK